MKYGVKRLGALTVAAATVMSMAACGSDDSGSDDKMVKLAHLIALTGATAATTGIPEDNAVKLAVEEINDAGGFEVDGTLYTIDLETEDNKSDATAGVTAVQKFRTSGAKFMVGTESSTVALAYLPIIQDDDNFLSIITGAAADGLTDHKSVYRPRVTLEQYTAATEAYIEDKGFKKVGLISDSQHAGFVAETPRFIEDVEAKGIEIVSNESYKLGDTDYSAQLTSIISKNPDVINSRGFGPDSARIVKQARELGYDGPMITNGGIAKADVEAADAADEMAGVVDIVAPYPIDIEESPTYGAAATKFVEAYRAKYNEDPGFLSATGYSAVYILVAAFQKAGTVDDVPKVREALDALKPEDVPGLVDSVQPNEEGLIFTDHQAAYQVATREWDPATGDLHATGFLSGGE